jgi:hypothetical protein
VRCGSWNRQWTDSHLFGTRLAAFVQMVPFLPDWQLAADTNWQ